VKEDLTKDEFCARFKAELIRLVGPSYNILDDVGDIEDVGLTAEYADETSKTYFDDPDQRAEGPEECARADYSYWE
jgi:hypothetical protein